MQKFLLLFHTVKYLKWKQIYYRVRRLVKSHPQIEPVTTSEIKRSSRWYHQLLHDEKVSPDLSATFLNQTKQLSLPEDWDNEKPSKLWVYNLHYFEELLSFNAEAKQDFHISLLQRWIKENPTGLGNAWEPYPISLRVANVLKAWLGGLQITAEIRNSIYQQAQYLSQDLERHLLGNHYFVNLKALFFAGIVFEHDEWIQLAERGLLEEIPEQILDDGANFELAPMYHNLILVDMLDMHNLASAFPDRVSERLKALIEEKIPLMLNYMNIMSHPDNGVSFFNDSTDGIAPSKRVIEDYAINLGFNLPEPLENDVFEGDKSGYFVAEFGASKLIFDGANVGPDYIPGHGHADTLSLELSVGKQRVLVNRGTSVYGLSQERLSQRKTSAHNTVEVNQRDSSQVWSGFRVAKRAKIIERSMKRLSEDSAVFEATHNGYKTLFGGCFHKRKVEFSKNKLVVFDSLEGDFQQAVGRFHFHPSVIVDLQDNELTITSEHFTMKATLSGKAYLTPAQWHPEFSQSIDTSVLEFEFTESTHQIIFTW